ncbi:MAG TPA: hypothetical protein ENI79_02325 [Rhodospirillales bacterium]|nr:hypothetical protein [Rhodospirillales bacterium]
MSQSIASFAVSLGANTAGFRRGMKSAGKSLRGFRNSVKNVTRSLTGFGARMAALATGGGLVLLLKQQAAQVDSLAKLSARLGDTADNMQALQIAATHAGVSTEKMTKGIQTMVKQIGNQALVPTLALTTAFERIGVTLEELRAMKASEQFVTIGEAIAGMTDVTDRAAIANQFFGRTGVEMLNLLTNAKSDFQSARLDVDAFGLSISGRMAKSVQAANDRLADIGFTMQGFGRTILEELSEPIRIIAQDFLEWAQSGEGVKGKVAGALRSVGEMVAWIVDKWDHLNVAIDAFATFVSIGASMAVGGMRVFAIGIEEIINLIIEARDAMAEFVGFDSSKFRVQAIDTTQGVSAQLEHLQRGLIETGRGRAQSAFDQIENIRSGGAQAGLDRTLSRFGFNQVRQGATGVDPQMEENNRLLRMIVASADNGLAVL